MVESTNAAGTMIQTLRGAFELGDEVLEIAAPVAPFLRQLVDCTRGSTS